MIIWIVVLGVCIVNCKNTIKGHNVKKIMTGKIKKLNLFSNQLKNLLNEATNIFLTKISKKREDLLSFNGWLCLRRISQAMCLRI